MNNLLLLVYHPLTPHRSSQLHYSHWFCMMSERTETQQLYKIQNEIVTITDDQINIKTSKIRLFILRFWQIKMLIMWLTFINHTHWNKGNKIIKINKVIIAIIVGMSSSTLQSLSNIILIKCNIGTYSELLICLNSNIAIIIWETIVCICGFNIN